MIPQSLFVKIGGISGALAVALGAYGAHGLKCSPEFKDSFMTGNRYHMYHSLAFIALSRAKLNRAELVGTALLSGMFLFSGSTYVAAIAENKSFSRLAPVGGMLMIIGWALIAF